MSYSGSRAPRLITYVALTYFMVRTSDSFGYDIAYITLVCLIWLNLFFPRHDQAKIRRQLVRDRLEFQRIVISPSGTIAFGQPQDGLVVVGTPESVTTTVAIDAGDDSKNHVTNLSNGTKSLLGCKCENCDRSLTTHGFEPAERIGKPGTDMESQDCCSICLETYKAGDSVARLKEFGRTKRRCNHWFHEDCILEWLQNHNRCPLCRVDMIHNDPKDTMRTTSRTPNYGTYQQPSNVTVV